MAIDKIKSLLVLLTISFQFSCAQPKHKVNPAPVKLNDSAVNMALHSPTGDKVMYEHAINLLNRAIKIDSNYLIAYNNKFSYQYQLKQYDSVLVTGKRILKLRPYSYLMQQVVGGVYEKLGDTISANTYYSNALLKCNKLLDTMHVENKAYKQVQADKAINLILLKKEKEGYGILKNLYENEPEGYEKELLKDYLTRSRHDFLYLEEPKEASVTAN